ncbi:MAG: aminotransferase class V-fold PLP-dependent enzyme [Deltaproteobacteria bacterium]|nr:aminotransferase class V-fold PLP-dependent enzyme [Deltaproteobacteria bacterium]
MGPSEQKPEHRRSILAEVALEAELDGAKARHAESKGSDLSSSHKDLKVREAVSLQLDTAPAEFAEWMAEISAFSDRFLKSLNDLPAHDREYSLGRVTAPFAQAPTPFATLLSELESNVLTKGMNSVSGRFMSYVPGGGLPTAALGDFLAALTNRYTANYGACIPGVEIENQCVGWLRDLVGMPLMAWGVLTSGGTLAALTALVAARDTRAAEEWRRGVVYVTDQAHHSIAKVLKTIGLVETPVRVVAVDSEFRMLVSALEDQITADRQEGLSPWILCATAGTTNTGAVDPLQELSQVAKREGLWFHIDAAYGGFFLMADQTGDLLKPLGLADSIVLDPHKGLFLPYGIGAVLVRDGAHLKNSFAFNAVYLHDLAGEAELSPSDFSIEATRHFRALRLWLSLKVHGTERFRNALEEKILLARHAYDRLSRMPLIAMGPYPQLSCTTFRVEGGDPRTRNLLDHINRQKVSDNSSTRLGGKLFLRLCILSFRTHLQEVDAALDEIERFR